MHDNAGLSAAPSTPTDKEVSLVNRVFLGPHGLRAGWSCLLFAAIFAAVYLLLSWLLRPVFLSMTRGMKHLTAMPLGLGLLSEGFMATCVIVATIAMAFVEGRPILSYGFQGKARFLRLISGLVWGFIAICAFVLCLLKLHLLSLDGQVLHGPAVFKYALSWAGIFLIVAFFEDSTMRGYLQFTLARGIGFWWAALLMSFLFGLSHGTNQGETHFGLISAGGVGLIFCLSLWYTGSLWWAIGFHAAWDWGQSFFFGTSDSGMVAEGHLLAEHPIGSRLWSGGTTGPEGSLLSLPLLALFAFCMWLWWGRMQRQSSPFSRMAWKPPAADSEMPIER